MKALTKIETNELLKEFVEIGTALTENENITTDIQTRTGNSLSNKAKREVFALYMTKLFPTDKVMVKRHMDCIDKAPTQRVMQGLKDDAKLSYKLKIRTADNGLVRKGIATKEQVAQKGIYHCFKMPIAKPAELTAQERVQKDVTEYSITEDDFKAMTIKWFVKA